LIYGGAAEFVPLPRSAMPRFATIKPSPKFIEIVAPEIALYKQALFAAFNSRCSLHLLLAEPIATV
jgi:hypothetical protein